MSTDGIAEPEVLLVPVLEPAVAKDFTPRPIPTRTPEPKRWKFSLRFWGQREFFGLAGVPNTWFVSVLERLKALSNEMVEDFLYDSQKKDVWRYHGINWNQKNIPIARSDIDWLPDVYRNNEDDYPMVQFSVSQSLGRVVGFWDEEDVFNIVLLDPMHNIQPTKSYNYRVDRADPLGCDYSHLTDAIDQFVQRNCLPRSCELASGIAKLPARREILMGFNVLMIRIPDDYADLVEEMRISGNHAELQDILVAGLEALTKKS